MQAQAMGVAAARAFPTFRDRLTHVNNPALHSDVYGGRTIPNIEFGKDIPDVNLRRFLADTQRCRDLFISKSTSYEFHHLYFARGQMTVKPSRQGLGRNLAACGTRPVCNATVTMHLTPTGFLYEDRWTQLDMRLSKLVRVGRVRMQGIANLYNVFNASPVLSVQNRYSSPNGGRWLNAQSILDARLFKIGAQVDF